LDLAELVFYIAYGSAQVDINQLNQYICSKYIAQNANITASFILSSFAVS